ncbi:Plant-drug/metabolite exporter [Parasponia andersonii]|uniref:WAT1-related protein n=1 Tax=Parasponia andersonii TaxID=3476 RepID=A0A2P5B0L1_PARAD|nr:Plant-drug/metabolite exporter [Parasponia andersonii]
MGLIANPATAMVIVQMSFAGVNVLSKLAANDGMSMRVVVAYRFTFATGFLLPLALFLERGIRPKLTWVVLLQAFSCGLFGAGLAQNLYLKSLELTSATYASAMFNLVPAITLILAVSLRIERVNFGKAAGKAKVLGALMGIGGALILTLYKGVAIQIWSTHIDLLHHNHNNASSSPAGQNHMLGCLLAVASCLCISLWLIIQAKMNEKYPCYYSSTALVSMIGAIQTVAYALWSEKDWNQWKLGWNIRLLTVAFSGIMASGIMLVLIAWCLHMRGPLFVSAFNPLMLVLVALAGSLFLSEKLHLGTVLAAILIVIGLYLVLWGKARETKRTHQLAPLESVQELPISTPDISIRSPPHDNTTCSQQSNKSAQSPIPCVLSL